MRCPWRMSGDLRKAPTEGYAALTPATKAFTSPDNCSACFDRSEAAVRTMPAAAPVSLAAWLTLGADAMRPIVRIACEMLPDAYYNR